MRNLAQEFAVVVVAVLLSACGQSSGDVGAGNDPTPSEIAADVSAPPQIEAARPAEIVSGTKVQVRTVANGPLQTLQLLPSKSAAEVEPMGAYIRDAGYFCNRVKSVRQLQEKGKPLDVFKIDCADGNTYQATLMNDNTYFKPWTGNLIGE